MLIGLAVIALIIVAFILTGVHGFVKHHGMWRITFRFIMGHHLDGMRRTDAGYFRRGRVPMHPTGYASRYAHWAHWQRTALRFAIVACVFLIGYGLVQNIRWTIYGLLSLVAAGIAFNIRMFARKFPVRYHAAGTTGPLAEALAPLLGTTPQIVAPGMTIRPDYTRTKSLETIGMIVLPDWFPANPVQREAIQHLITSRLGVEVQYGWHTVSHPMTLELIRAPIPPKMVKFTDVLAIMESLPANEVMLGISGQGKTVTWDLQAEEPHAMVQANSRRGKTRLLLLIVCQLLRKGAELVVVIDPKRIGVDLVLDGIKETMVFSNPKDVLAMWSGITKIRDTMDTRIDQVAEDRTREFRPALLVIDEASMFSAMTKRLWDATRDPKKTRAVPAIWDDLAAIVWEGAQVNVHALVFGQRLEAATFGKLLESFGTRLIAGYTKQGYDRLIGINPMPVSQKPRGRFLYSDGEDLTWIQTVLGEIDDLRAYARKGATINTSKPSLEDVIDRLES
jgi:hypothetical protein